MTDVMVHLTTAPVCIFKCSSGWGNWTTWTQNNGADYECCIALKPRMTDLPPAGEVWAALFTFNPYLLISINELLISIIHLLISINELLISINKLLISINELLISINEL